MKLSIAKKIVTLGAMLGLAAGSLNAQIILNSRDADTGSPMPYFSGSPGGGVFAPVGAASTVGGNSGSSLYTSGNYNAVGDRSGVFLLDSAALGFNLSGDYEVDITWANQSNLKLVRIEVTDTIGTTTFNNVDQKDGINTWMNLGVFNFDGDAGQELRIWNNEDASSGNVNFDSIRLTLIPEPSTLSLALLGGLGMLLTVRRRRA